MTFTILHLATLILHSLFCSQICNYKLKTMGVAKSFIQQCSKNIE